MMKQYTDDDVKLKELHERIVIKKQQVYDTQKGIMYNYKLIEKLKEDLKEKNLIAEKNEKVKE